MKKKEEEEDEDEDEEEPLCYFLYKHSCHVFTAP
jgi:hypothetical protein